MKREFSAGGVVFQKSKNPKIQASNNEFKVLFLVRRASGREEYRGSLGWTLPKGWIDEGETAEEAAVREVREEGGVEAKIVKKIDTIKIFFTDVGTKEKVMKFITYYLMEWERDVPGGFGWETEEAAWMDGEAAIKNLAYESEKKMVKKALEMIYA